MHGIYRILLILLAAYATISCTGTQVFSGSARAGETVAFALGWNQELTSSDISMTITDSLQNTVTLPSRAIVNLYPDPVSNLIVEMETDPESSPDTNSGAYWGYQMENSVTTNDKDYSQKLIVADIPASLYSGVATIEIITPSNTKYIDIEILEPLPGAGESDNFGIQESPYQSLSVSFGDKLRLAERAPHYVINFDGAQVPYAMEIILTHGPDRDNNGIGRPFVTSGRSDVKNIAWSDNGTDMKVILTPASANKPLQSFQNFKFYVAGGLTGLLITNVNAYDLNGQTIQGITAQLVQY